MPHGPAVPRRKPAKQSPSTQQATTSPADLKALRAQIDEAKREKDLLTTKLAEDQAHYDAEWSHAQLDEVFETYKKTGMFFPYAEKDVRMASAGRETADRWHKDARPRMIAEIERLTKDIGGLEDEYEAGLQKLAADRGADTGRDGMVTFVRLKTGKTVAQKPYSEIALLNTYEAVSQALDLVRALVSHREGRGGDKTTIRELRENLAPTVLGEAADPDDWNEWIEIFAGPHPAPVKGVALVFLERKTSRPRESLKTVLSNARNRRRVS